VATISVSSDGRHIDRRSSPKAVTASGSLMDSLSELRALGLELPSLAYVIGAVVFGLIGLVAFRYGRKTRQGRILWLGVALMLYPYVISSTALLYAIGLALCAAIWLSR
jgi:hypothetical protein